MEFAAARPDLPRMRSHRPLAGVLALLSILLGLGAFVCVMSGVGGFWPFLAFPASAITAVAGFVALGAPRSRRRMRLAHD
jgi:hypothetical protein